MEKVKFSTKFLLSTSIIVVVISIVSIILLLSFIGLMNKITISYTKGTSLLTTYLQAYVNSKYISQHPEKTKQQLENPIKSFNIFYDILNGKDIPIEEIEKNWLEFGMKKDEIKLVVAGTKLLRNTDFLSPVKDSAEKVKNYLDNIDRISPENVENLTKTLINFTESFYKTFNTISNTTTLVVSILFLMVIIILIIYFLRILYLIQNLRNLTNKLPSIAKSLVQEEIKELDIIDPKSELYPIQESFSMLIDKIQKLTTIKNNLKNTISKTHKNLEIQSKELEEFMSNISNLKSKMENIDIKSTLKYLETLQQTFSLLDSSIKEVRNDIEKIRSISTGVLEPISTVYEILEESFRQYNLAKEIVFKYISETKSIIETIQLSFSKSSEGIEDVLEELKKISLNLRSIGINASIEFSKISSANEALSNIANKIIELSRSLGTIFGNIRSNLENLETELSTSISKVKTFIESFAEISKNIDEVGNTIQNIREEKNKNIDKINTAHSILGEIINEIQKLDQQNDRLLNLFLSFQEKIKHTVEFTKTVIEISQELDRYAKCTDDINEVIRILEESSKEIEKV